VGLTDETDLPYSDEGSSTHREVGSQGEEGPIDDGASLSPRGDETKKGPTCGGKSFSAHEEDEGSHH
jgi:hypothetical protein